MSIHWLEINFKGLQIDLPQNFNHANTEFIMTLTFVWKFCIIFSISLLEKFRVSKRFSVVKWSLRGSSILLFIKEHCFSKKKLKSSYFFLKSVTYSFPWKKGGTSGIFLLFKNVFNSAQCKLLCFFVFELIYKLFGNNNLVWKLQFRYVGLLVEVSLSLSIVFCYCFYYFDSFYRHCFSLVWDIFCKPKGVVAINGY